MDNRSLLSLPAYYPTQLCDRALPYTFMTSHDYTSFQVHQVLFLLHIPKWFMKILFTKFFSICTVCSLVPVRGSACLIKTQPGKLLICICSSGMKQSTSLLSAQRSACEDPKGVISPVCPFYAGSKPWTRSAICFCPPLNFIYSPVLVIKPKIYDFLFN